LDNLGIDFQSATMDAGGTRLPTPGAFTGKFQEIMDGAENWGDVAERLKGQTVTYFDFETTGIADYDGQNIFNDPIQLGAVQVKDGKIVKRFNVYMNPESKLSEWSGNNLKRDVVDENGDRVLDENGKPASTLVTPDWLAEQQSQEQALQDFIEFIGPNALLGGQNVPFDVEILKRMAERSGIQLDIAGTIDSKDLASLLPKYNPETGVDGPKAPDRKTGEVKATSSLGPVANFLGFEPANWHSADGDAEDSYNLVSKIIDRAAAEDSKDLSLLDFPAMQQRYEERMAEFKQVVSPDSPVTESQQKALETLSQSNNPAVSQKAAEGLATATTRGEAAKVLFEANELEDLGSQPPSAISSESDPDFDDVEPKGEEIVTLKNVARPTYSYNENLSATNVRKLLNASGFKTEVDFPGARARNPQLDPNLVQGAKSLVDSTGFRTTGQVRIVKGNRGRSGKGRGATNITRDEPIFSVELKYDLNIEVLDAIDKGGVEKLTADLDKLGLSLEVLGEGNRRQVVVFDKNARAKQVSEAKPKTPEQREINAIESDPDFSDSKPDTPVKYDTNAEESDPDFDDADFDDYDFAFEESTATADTPLVIGGLVDFVIEEYGYTLSQLADGSTEIEGLSRLFSTMKDVEEAAAELDSDPNPRTKKEYMDALQGFINARATLFHVTNHFTFLGRDSKADSKLTSDPRLTSAEVALINSRITLVDAENNNAPLKPLGPLTERQKEKRRTIVAQSLTQYRASLAELDSKMKRPAGLPDNWQLTGNLDIFEEEFKSSAPTATLFSSLISANRAFTSENTIFARPGYVRVRDTTGAYPGTLTLSNTGTSIKPDELAAMVGAVENYGKKIDYTAGRYPNYNMLITTSNNENPIRVKNYDIFGSTALNVAAYSNPLTGNTFFVDRLRNEQQGIDAGKLVQFPNTGEIGTSRNHWSSYIRPNSQDVFSHVVAHEFGHATDAAFFRESDSLMQNKRGVSLYGATSPAENYAEHMARYMRGESVPDWFIEHLRSKGALKSQQSNNNP
jgi:DNA polymerase III epsilon subunit-like protein